MVDHKMKRLILLIAAVAGVATAMPLTAPALARGGDQGGRAERQEGRRGGPERGGPERGGHERGGPQRGDQRHEPERGGPRWEGDERGRGWGDARPRDSERRPRDAYERPRDDERRRYDGGRPDYMQGPRRDYERPAPGAARRGYLPDSYRGEVVDNYRRYRLRPPPHGFAWVRVGNGFALVEMGSGRIFDRVN